MEQLTATQHPDERCRLERGAFYQGSRRRLGPLYSHIRDLNGGAQVGGLQCARHERTPKVEGHLGAERGVNGKVVELDLHCATASSQQVGGVGLLAHNLGQ